MKKIISVIVTAVMIVNLIPYMLLMSSAASSCPKGHAYVEHYCKTCNQYETNYTGLAKKNSTWYYVQNGKADSSYTGMAKNDYGWWYVKSGKIDFTYTGMAKNAYGWWYMKKGAIDYKYVGLAKNAYGWWYIKKGTIDYKYVGMAKNDYGWWYVKNGTIDFKFTGMAKNDYGWWYMKNGKLDTTYTGISKNDYGNWYMKNGKLDKSYNGTYTDKNGTKWSVTNGKAVKKTSNSNTTTTTTSKYGTYEVDPVKYGFSSPVGTVKRAWIVKSPNGQALSQSGLDVRISRIELNKTVTQRFDTNVSRQIVNPKTISYKPCCSLAVITCTDGDPTHIKLTENTSGKTAQTPDLAKSVNAVMAVNGHTMEYHEDTAAVIRNGRIFKRYTGNGTVKHPRLIMYRDGTWEIGTLDNEEAQAAVARGAYNSICYQDVTVRDGKLTAYIQPKPIYHNRTYLGQISKTKYIMMVTEFMPIDDVANLLISYGCKTVIQIEGGNCAHMYVNNVGNTTGTNGASVRDLNKIGYLETEWYAGKGMLEGKKGGGPCGHEIDVLYVK